MKQPQKTEPADPLDMVLKEHDLHQKMCDLLEEIADSLPNKVDRKKARHAANTLKYDLPLHHRLEEEALFPLLVKYAADEDNAGEIIGRLSDEHVVDEGFAEELVEVLEQLAQGKPLEDANMFGYMLRGFFENYRRHIIWENSVVLPLVRRRFPADGLRELASLIADLQTGSCDQDAKTPACPACNEYSGKSKK